MKEKSVRIAFCVLKSKSSRKHLLTSRNCQDENKIMGSDRDVYQDFHDIDSSEIRYVDLVLLDKVVGNSRRDVGVSIYKISEQCIGETESQIDLKNVLAI